MKAKSIFFFLLLACSSAFSQTPKIKWWHNTKDFSAGQTASKDIDGDGKKELVFGCYRNDSSIYALNSENGTLLWKYNASAVGTHGCNDVAPIIYNVDNIGSEEVIVPASCNPKTFCFNGPNGTVKWVANTKGSDSPPTIADVDNDGKPEVLHGEFGGYVLCLNAEDGSQAWEIKVDGNSWIQTAPTIVDLDNNGQLDFVVATWNFNYKDSIFAFRGNNQTRLWAYPVHDHIYHGTAVADLDNDGKPELLIGSYNDTLHCINGENGTTAWKYCGTGYVGSPAAIGDIDNDGICDVVFTNGSQVTALSNSGTLKWTYTIPNFGQAFRGVALADMNKDVYLDVVFGSSKGQLMALNGNNGSLQWSIDLAAHYGNSQYSLSHAPVISDFDGDDTLDVFIVGGYGIYPNTSGNFGRAYMVSVAKGNGPDWLMFQRDIWRQSSMCSNSPTEINELENGKENTIVYPNPAHSVLNFKLSEENESANMVKIFNSNGSLVVEEEIHSADYKININEWPAGIYFYQVLFDENKTATGKFVVEK